MSIFTSKKFEKFQKKSADKIWIKNDKEIKVLPLIPIRVKLQKYSGKYGECNFELIHIGLAFRLDLFS